MKMLVILLVILVMYPSANAAIEWNYWSRLKVFETILDIGNGNYKYEYSFTNEDDSLIWGFAVYTNFFTQAETTFISHSEWRYGTNLIINTAPEYDARNLDSSITMFTGTSCILAPGHEVQNGEFVQGFSFTAPIYNPAPKYYFYETTASGYTQTNGTGRVAAVGTTIPEPAMILFLAFGGLLLRTHKK